ncbi:Wzz/FepE/Etk N-terminal domain-containing protein [Nocardioides sp. C4-1]|uniref:Wzz/FepE/Etk N-terminal domain-containing protein n=1 Tax=Nocardioides sp. C4-1 TaxID=3151851 RepID=UPI00326689C2
MEPQDVSGALWRQRWLVLAVFATTGGLLALGLLVAPKTYTATATVSAVQNPSADVDVAVGDLDALRGTMAELVGSRAVADAVQAELSAPRTIGDLRRHLDGTWVRGTVLVEVVATDSDPDVAAEMANLAAAQLPLVTPSGDSFLFTTTSTARAPMTYSQPDLLVVGAIALGLAVVLSCLGAVVRDRRRSTVDDGWVAEDAAGSPLLGHVSPPRDLTALPALRPGTSAADDFRRLRLSVEVEHDRDPVDVVVVAGIGGGEINVWLGANLAVALADVGRRVLLVDGRLDDRSDQPLAVHRTGLREVLGGHPLDEALVDGPVDGLRVLAAGGPGRSGETLVESGWADVRAAARRIADVVIVLAPPLDGSDDARVLAAGGSMLLAVPEGTVPVASLRAHSARVRAAGARLLGVVLVGHRAERAERADRVAA